MAEAASALPPGNYSPFGAWVVKWTREAAIYLNMDLTPDGVFNPDPEQKWLLGNRFADLSLSLVFALLFPLLRTVLTRTVFQPLGIRYLSAAKVRKAALARAEAAKASKTAAAVTGSGGGGGKQQQQQVADVAAAADGPEDSKPDPDKLRKWNESAWKMTVYILLTSVGFLVSFREKWFSDSRFFWVGCTHFPPCNLWVSPGVLLFYCMETGFYLQAIHFLLFHEVRRKDWAESMAHHVVTSGLLLYSYSVNFCRVGTMVMLVHDINDIFLEMAKCLRYAEMIHAAEVAFALFFSSWIICRLIIFPFFIIRSTLIEPVALVGVHYGIDPHPHWAIFNSLLLVLLVLHIYWTYLIGRILWNMVFKRKVDDIREVDSDDD